CTLPSEERNRARPGRQNARDGRRSRWVASRIAEMRTSHPDSGSDGQIRSAVARHRFGSSGWLLGRKAIQNIQSSVEPPHSIHPKRTSAHRGRPGGNGRPGGPNGGGPNGGGRSSASLSFLKSGSVSTSVTASFSSARASSVSLRTFSSYTL